MKILRILLIVVGLAGFGIGTLMYDDIGIAAMIASVIGILSGVGFLQIKTVVATFVSQNNEVISNT